MKQAIVQIDINSKEYKDPTFNNLYTAPIVKYSEQSFKEYCEKYSIDYIKINKPTIACRHPVFERFDLILNEKWWKTYDQILYCDTDVIVDPTCPNFFKKFPNTNTMKTAVYPKYQKQSIAWKQLIKKVPLYRKLNSNSFKKRFFQTGVWSITQNCAKILKPYIKHFNKFKHYDDGQILNWAFIKANVPHEKINANWNFKLTDKPVPTEGSVNFIHAAGGRKHAPNSYIIKYCKSRWPEIQ